MFFDDADILFHCSKEDVLSYLAEGVDINYVNHHGENALFHSDASKSLTLIKNGINVNHRDNFGKTALFDSGFEKAKILLEYGAEPNIITNKTKINALFTTNNVEKMKLLIKYNINIHHINENGENAVFCNVSLDKIKLLHSNGINLHIKNNNGYNLLSYLTLLTLPYTNIMEIADYLINNHIEIEPLKELIKKMEEDSEDVFETVGEDEIEYCKKFYDEISIKKEAFDILSALDNNQQQIIKKRI